MFGVNVTVVDRRVVDRVAVWPRSGHANAAELAVDLRRAGVDYRLTCRLGLGAADRLRHALVGS